MKKKTIIIGGGILLILIYFGFNSYQNIEKKNAKFPKYARLYKGNVNILEENNKNKEENKLSNNGQTFFKFSSTLYDIEVNGITVQTKKELTYHTIDLNREIIKMESKSNGKWIEITYPIKKWYKEEGPYSTTYVFIIKSLGVQEFWWIPEVPSLGYDYDDGKRIACYNITRIK